MFSFPRVNGEQNMVGYTNFYFLPKRFVTAIPQAEGKAITANLTQAIPFFAGYSVFGNLQFKDDPERTPAGVKFPIEVSGSAPVDKPEYLALFEEMVEDEFIVLVADLNGRIKICGSQDKGLRFIYKTEGTGYTFKFYGQYDAAPAFYFGAFTVDSTAYPAQTYNPPAINPGPGGVTGLQPEQILFGSSIGTIEQSPLLYWKSKMLNVNATSFQNRININGVLGNGYINFNNQAFNVPSNSSGSRLFANDFGYFSFVNQNSHPAHFSTINHTSARTYLWQDKSGTVAHLDDIPVFANTNTIEFTQTTSPLTVSANVRMQHSITTDANGIRLVNDVASPGANRVYGTDAIGNKTWRNLSLVHFEESTGTYLSQQWNRWAAIGTPTNINLVLRPKGDGYLSLQIPDGTLTGGNQRGSRAVDLQRTRSDATQVSSGIDSFAATRNSTASSTGAFAACGGRSSGQDAASFGGLTSGQRSFSANNTNNIASGQFSSAFGEQTWIGGRSSFGVGVFARQNIDGAFVIGNGIAGVVSGAMVTTFMFLDENAVVNGTPYSFSRGIYNPIIFGESGGSREVGYLNIRYAAITNGTPAPIWVREVTIALRGDTSLNTIVNTQVIYEHKNAGFGASTIVESITGTAPNTQLAITFTPDATVAGNNVDIQAFVTFFKKLGTS